LKKVRHVRPSETSSSSSSNSNQTSRTTRKRSKKRENKQNKQDETNEQNVLTKNLGVKVKYTKSSNKNSQDNYKEFIREECNCQCLEHKLITNCTACGRIVCEKEGEGECFFCGSIVTSTGTVMNPEFIQMMCSSDTTNGQSSNTNSRDLTNDTERERSERDTQGGGTGDNDEASQNLVKAIQHKNKLLEYGVSKANRTNIVDDQADYYDFANNMWLEEKERSRLMNQVITL